MDSGGCEVLRMKQGIRALPPVKSKYFGCSSCNFLVYPNGHYWFCDKGHFLCNDCAILARRECPLEHPVVDDGIVRIYEWRCPLYKSMIEAGIFSCANKDKGCDETFSAYELEKHLKMECKFRIKDVCRISGCLASVGGNVLEHYAQNHNVPTYSGSFVQLGILYDRPEKYTLTSEIQWVSCIIHCFNTNFGLAVMQRGQEWIMWVQTYDADMKGARRFSAELSILWEEAKCDKLEWKSETRGVAILHYTLPVDDSRGAVVLPVEVVEAKAVRQDELRYFRCSIRLHDKSHGETVENIGFTDEQASEEKAEPVSGLVSGLSGEKVESDQLKEGEVEDSSRLNEAVPEVERAIPIQSAVTECQVLQASDGTGKVQAEGQIPPMGNQELEPLGIDLESVEKSSSSPESLSPVSVIEVMASKTPVEIPTSSPTVVSESNINDTATQEGEGEGIPASVVCESETEKLQPNHSEPSEDILTSNLRDAEGRQTLEAGTEESFALSNKEDSSGTDTCIPDPSDTKKVWSNAPCEIGRVQAKEGEPSTSESTAQDAFPPKYEPSLAMEEDSVTDGAIGASSSGDGILKNAFRFFATKSGPFESIMGLVVSRVQTPVSETREIKAPNALQSDTVPEKMPSDFSTENDPEPLESIHGQPKDETVVADVVDAPCTNPEEAIVKSETIDQETVLGKLQQVVAQPSEICMNSMPASEDSDEDEFVDAMEGTTDASELPDRPEVIVLVGEKTTKETCEKPSGAGEATSTVGCSPAKD